MKKINITLVGAFFTCASIGYSAEPLPENVEPPYQQRAEVMHQARTDQDEIPACVRAMHREQFRNSNMAKIQKEIEEAQKEGLPVKPLTDKVHEGIAKNVAEEDIVEAVGKVRSRYARAYQKARRLGVEPDQEEPLGDVIAGAEVAGLTDTECDRIMAALQTRTRTMSQNQHQEHQDLTIQTLTAARTMARRGVTSETISEVLANALEQSYQARDMNTMRHVFVQRAQHGSAESIARQIAHRIGQGSDPAALATAAAWSDQKNDTTGSKAGPGGPGGDDPAGSDKGNGPDSGGPGGAGGSNSNSDASGGSGGSSGSSSGSGGSGDSSGSSAGSGDSGSSSSGSTGSGGSSSSSSDSTGSGDSGSSSSGSTGSGNSSGSSGGSAGSSGSSGGQSGGGRGK